MTAKDRKYIAAKLDFVIEALQSVKEDFLESENPVDFVGEIHDNMAHLSHIVFLLGQQTINMVYERLLPKEVLKEVETKFKS